MIFRLFFVITLLTNLLLKIMVESNCFDLKIHTNFNFYLWKSYQRSSKERIFVDNVDNLKACKVLTRKYRGLAFNYSPKERFIKPRNDTTAFRDHYWNQPQLYFNCHILQCPENDAFKSMVNDSSFDYYSLYEKPMASDYTCIPEVGLFVLHSNPEKYYNAILKCHYWQNNCGSLAHVASQKRTEALANMINGYNEQRGIYIKNKIYLAFVGLHYNSTWPHNFDFYNDEKEYLKCFPYRAWDPGNPKMSSEFTNASCVALTIKRSWKTVKCDRHLPFICEIWTSCN